MIWQSFKAYSRSFCWVRYCGQTTSDDPDDRVWSRMTARDVSFDTDRCVDAHCSLACVLLMTPRRHAYRPTCCRLCDAVEASTCRRLWRYGAVHWCSRGAAKYTNQSQWLKCSEQQRTVIKIPIYLGHRLGDDTASPRWPSRLELRCVRTSVRTSTKRFFRFPSNLVCG